MLGWTLGRDRIGRLSQRVFIVVAIVCGTAPSAVADPTIDPLIGVRIAMLGSQQVLAAPPLPGLEDSREGSLSPQAGYMTASIHDSVNVAPSIKENVDGSYTGYTGSLGYTSAAKGHFGFYVFGTYDRLDGHIDLTNGQGGATLADMSNTGLAVSGGISWRVGGAKGQPFSFGVFGGPAYLHLSSSFQYKAAPYDGIGDPGPTANYSSNPDAFGAFGGVQLGMRIGKLWVNPYVVRYQNLSGNCAGYTTDAVFDNGNGFSDACPGGGRTVLLAVTFTGYGINAGWGDFYLTAYSNVIKDQSVSDVSVHIYQLSYSFKL